jgi:hypothetical protein
LLPLTRESSDEWILHCSCDRPSVRSQWRWDELKICEVSNAAHERGYGTPEEILRLGNFTRQRLSGARR